MQLTYKEVCQGLRALGFEPRPQKATSHEQWVRESNGRFYKVTVDEPKSPFSDFLIGSMASQAGIKKKHFIAACTDKAERKKIKKN